MRCIASLCSALPERKTGSASVCASDGIQYEKGWSDMKKVLSVVLAALLSLALPCPALCEDRPVLTIGDVSDRSSKRVDGENQLGLWRYLEDQLGVEIQYVYLSSDDYAAGLSSGNLPDIVATSNNLSTILENGVALDVDPYG